MFSYIENNLIINTTWLALAQHRKQARYWAKTTGAYIVLMQSVKIKNKNDNVKFQMVY